VNAHSSQHANTPGPSGLLIIDKPYRMTSMRVCSIIRARLRAGGAPKRVKVGHGGTLDPLATGVLVVLVGRATRLCERVMQGTKSYIAEIDLAHISPTDDLESAPQPAPGTHRVDRHQFELVTRQFVGHIEQIPPAHSAVKVGGRRAYSIARRGNDPDLQPRTVRIDTIKLLSLEWPIASVEVTCGKGVYLRSLARDLGRSLGGGGMLVSLRRTRVGEFSIDLATSLDALAESLDADDLIPLPADQSSSAGSAAAPESSEG